LLLEQVSGPIKKARVLTTRKSTEAKANPLPGPLSAIKFSESTNKKLWTLRALLKDHWIFRAYIHGLFKTKFKVTLNDAIGLTLGLTTVVLYNTGAKVWWLTNILGVNFCYGILQILSPTTFWTATLVLTGLFAYDIIMVFYTPMMITVAKSLQAPIMLVIPGPSRGSMLGLGDIALPGMVMAMALRFDLYLHYLRKQRILPLDTSNPNNKKEIIKAPYENATGLWGERFWTHCTKSTSTSTAITETTVADGARFSKIYFKASIVGYIIAMLVTMAVMHHFKHGQPALLYLVPGVLGALWGTAAVRGETKLMWEYCEDGEWGFEERKNKNSEPKSHESEKVGEQNQTAEETRKPKLMAMKGFTAGLGPNGTDTAAQQLRLPNDKSSVLELGKAKEGKMKSSEDEEHTHHVFLFSLSTAQPKKGKGLKIL
jgi:minor histocompatibility antigen H13